MTDQDEKIRKAAQNVLDRHKRHQYLEDAMFDLENALNPPRPPRRYSRDVLIATKVRPQ